MLVIDSPLAAILALGFLGGVLLFHARDPALVLACAGLLTVSWDRVSIRAGGMTLKPAYAAFAFALAVDGLRMVQARGPAPASSRTRLIRQAVLASLFLLAIATVNGGYLLAGARQLFVIAFGALVPAWVCFRLGQAPARRRVLISWALIGAGFAAALGIYQFAANYLGLPTVLRYTGVGGALGRTAGLSYEPAVFSMYLISLVPLSVVLLIERKGERSVRTAPRLVFCLLLVGLLVSNARAGYLALPFALLVPLLSRSPRAVRARPVLIVWGTIVFALLLSTVVRFDAVGFVGARLASVADTQEQASNAPRLLLYKTSGRIAADHLVIGIGPGALGQALPEYGFPGDQVPDLTRAVANNIWLQAVLDCGVLGPIGVAIVLGTVYWLSRRCKDVHGRSLALGVLLVMLVGGLLTSTFWDARYWTLIGLMLAADSVPTRPAKVLVTQ